MVKYNLVRAENTGISKLDPTDFVSLLNDQDKRLLNRLYDEHHRKNYRQLIQYTYTHFPYYAVNSTIADRYLSGAELENITKNKPSSELTTLYTIGYEGISLEQYLNKLIAKDIKVLVDVRRNPFSMKQGFSKSQLLNACSSVGIKYLHFPKVGIASEQRQQLNTQEEYDKLFSIYRTESLPTTIPEQTALLELLKENKRIALTCFEANICQCHRKHLAEAISKLPQWNYEIIHI